MNLNEWNLKHPRQVTDLLKAQEKLEQVIDAPAPDTSGLFNQKTVESTLDAMIQHALVSGSERLRAVNHARTLIENKLNQAIQSNLDDYLEQASETFDAAAEQYEDYINLLPTKPYDAEDVLAFSPEQRNAYEKVTQAAGVLEAWMNWSLELTELPGQGLGQWAKWFVLLDPETVGGLLVAQLEEGTGSTAWERTLPVLGKALKEGAALRLAAPTTARREADLVEGQRQDMGDEDYRLLRVGLGY